MTTIGAAVATVQERKAYTPRALIEMYQPELAAVLPTHIKSEAWLKQVGGALKRGQLMRDGSGRFELEVAAQNNPQAFVNALRIAAALGLTPGTDEFYLTPRPVKGVTEILGIVGYQGYIELMYRAGAVSSVIVENVYSNDKFTYVPGRDDKPVHEIDWFAEDRGTLVLSYAYAIMRDGATSKVVVLNKTDIARSKAKAQRPDGEYSPWKTNEPSMWLKSAARQLRKWVPTSAEYITTQLRAVREAEDGAPVHLPPLHIPDTSDVVIEAEFVDGDDDAA